MSDPFGGMPFFGDLSRLLGQQGPVAWAPAGQLALTIATNGQPEVNVDPLERMRIEQLARVAEVQLSGIGLDPAPGGHIATIVPVTRSQWVQQTLDELRPRFEAIAAALGRGGGAAQPGLFGMGMPGSAPPGSSGASSASTPPTSTPAGSPTSTAEPTAPLDPAFAGLEDLAGLGAEFDRAEAASGHPSLDPDGDGDLTRGTADGLDGDGEDAFLGGFLQLLSPMLLGMTAGSLVGHLATHCFGTFDVPLATARPRAGLRVVPANLDAFGASWSLDGDDLRLWVCLHELTHHAIWGLPHVGGALDALLGAYTEGFRADPDALARHLGELEADLSDLSGLQHLLSDPEVLLGAEITDEQHALRPRIDALVAVVEGYVDVVMDQVGERLIGSYERVTEAVRRHRVESGDARRFLDRLFGLDLGQALYDRGSAFCQGVVERTDRATLDQLWSDPTALPTPAELVAPGLWLARRGIA